MCACNVNWVEGWRKSILSLFIFYAVFNFVDISSRKIVELWLCSKNVLKYTVLLKVYEVYPFCVVLLWHFTFYYVIINNKLWFSSRKKEKTSSSTIWSIWSIWFPLPLHCSRQNSKNSRRTPTRRKKETTVLNSSEQFCCVSHASQADWLNCSLDGDLNGDSRLFD